MSLPRPALALALASLLLGAACSKTKPADRNAAGSGSGSGSAVTATGPADPRSQAIVDKSKELRDRACACTDAACANAVRADHDTWLRAQIDEMAKLGEPSSTKAQQDAAATYQRELFACLDKQTKPAAPATGSGSAPATP